MAEYHKIINAYRSRTNKKEWDNNKKLAKLIGMKKPISTIEKSNDIDAEN